MKITLKRDVFLKKIGLLNSNLDNKGVIPVYSQALFFFKEEKLFAKTTNNWHTLTIQIPFESVEGDQLSFVCDTALIQKVFSNYKTDDIFLGIEDEDKRISFGGLHLKKKYEIAIEYQPSDFPATDEDGMTHLFNMKGNTFADCFKKASVFNVDKDVSVPQFAGVGLIITKEEVRFQSSDKFVICNIVIPIEGENEESIILERGLNSLSDLFTNATELKFFLSGNKNSIFITDGISTVFSRLMNGSFKDMIDRFVTQFSGKQVVTFERDEILMSIKRLSALCDPSQPYIDFYFNGHDEGMCFLETKHININRQGSDPIGYTAKNMLLDFRLRINTNFLLQTISNCEGDNVMISMEDKKSFPEIKGSAELPYSLSYFVSPTIQN